MSELKNSFNVKVMDEFIKKDGKVPLGFFGDLWLHIGWEIENTNESLLGSHIRSEWEKGKMLE